MTYSIKCFPGDEPRITVTNEFVERNNLKIDTAIALDLARNSSDAIFYFEREVAASFIPFKAGIDLWTEEYKRDVVSGEIVHHHISDVKEAAQDFLDYMVFAWMKAIDERGLSAERSIIKLATWMKILRRPDVAAALEDELSYTPYGRPALRKACDMLGIECPERL